MSIFRSLSFECAQYAQYALCALCAQYAHVFKEYIYFIGPFRPCGWMVFIQIKTICYGSSGDGLTTVLKGAVNGCG